jgi:hypothetical protein
VLDAPGVLVVAEKEFLVKWVPACWLLRIGYPVFLRDSEEEARDRCMECLDALERCKEDIPVDDMNPVKVEVRKSEEKEHE